MPGVLKTVAIDGMGDGAFCIGQNDPNLSNEVGVLLANGVVYPAGTVLARFTSGGNTGKLTAVAPGASDGSQIAVGILWGRKEISGTDQKCVFVARHQPVNGYALSYINAMSGPQKIAAEGQLAASMVMVRY